MTEPSRPAVDGGQKYGKCPGFPTMGHIPAAQAPGLVAFQLAWTAIIVAMGRMLLSRGVRRLVVQGG